MSEMSRLMLVVSIIIVLALGLLEVVLSRVPVEPPARVSTRAARLANPWHDYVDAEGRALRLDAGSVSEPPTR